MGLIVKEKYVPLLFYYVFETFEYYFTYFSWAGGEKGDPLISVLTGILILWHKAEWMVLSSIIVQEQILHSNI